MKNKGIIKLVMLFCLGIFVSNTYSQQIKPFVNWQTGDTLLITVSYTGKNVANLQRVKCWYAGSMAFVKLYDKHKMALVARDSLSKERAEAAVALLNVKADIPLPEKYKAYASTPISDSAAVLRLIEWYEEEHTITHKRDEMIDCLQQMEVWLAKKEREKENSETARSTKIVFKKADDTAIYFEDGYLDVRKIFSCLFQ
ncbi:hypothetical protein F0L74_20920 [Chitinophaga agrisoli]|uniref:Uncharacterized protein n=1 Tax=Chitinophaga agrisoli TaxID=2607653 RepID=A0A5B2VID2_9BACT|nr:hypothetical protein [Chitinophaga agrisoli]KAA2238684.1 hypothetical protein F0L74_20920 [Chitinophaga agrisoli]